MLSFRFRLLFRVVDAGFLIRNKTSKIHTTKTELGSMVAEVYGFGIVCFGFQNFMAFPMSQSGSWLLPIQ